jgi:hypothetical protein
MELFDFIDPFSAPVRAAFGVQALVGHAQPLDRLAAHQVLLNDVRGIRGVHVAVPDRLGINHHHGPVFALVQAAGLVDAHRFAQARGPGKLLQLDE